MCYESAKMASKPPNPSSLNPNAPAFVPASYFAAEDFSPEWYNMIQTSTSFREWWMKERYLPEENEQAAVTTELDDIDDLLELGFQSGALDDLEDNPSPVASQQQSQPQSAFHDYPRYPRAQPQVQQQVPQQQYFQEYQPYPRQYQQQPPQLQNQNGSIESLFWALHRKGSKDFKLLAPQLEWACKMERLLIRSEIQDLYEA